MHTMTQHQTVTRLLKYELNISEIKQSWLNFDWAYSPTDWKDHDKRRSEYPLRLLRVYSYGRCSCGLYTVVSGGAIDLRHA